MPKQIATYLVFFLLCFLSISIHAQIDTKKKNIFIPAVEAEDDSLDASPTTSIKPLKNNSGVTRGVNKPKPLPNIRMPKKEFSMFSQEKFGNSGELYTDRIKKHQNSIVKKLELGKKGSKVDLFFGDHKTKSKTVRVYYRDYGEEDGDLIRIFVNGEIVSYRTYLTSVFKWFDLELKEGINTIEFLAIDEGWVLPNSAHFRIVDEDNKIIAADLWGLSKNVKGIVNIIKEP